MTVAKETYVAFLLDRQSGGPVMIASAEGGMDIEAVAHATPDKIIRVPIDPKIGLTEQDSLKVAERIGFQSPQVRFTEQSRALSKSFPQFSVLILFINIIF